MTLRSELFLALRYLKPKGAHLSLITLTSILGVTLGVAVLIVVMAVMTGFTDQMKSKLIETQAHFQIHRPGAAIGLPAYPISAVKECGGDAAPVIQGAVLIQYGYNHRSLDTQSILFAADEKELCQRLNLESHLVAGKVQLGRKNGCNYAVISSDMALRWNVGIGDSFLVHSARKLTSLVRFGAEGGVELNKESSAYLPTKFFVSGIYSLGKSDFDRMVFFTDLDDAAELFDLPWGAATSIFGWGSDPFHQEKLIEALRDKLPQFEVRTWEENNRKFLDVLAMEKLMMFFLLIFIVLVAAFSISNTLITSVYRKTREIGLLKALGCSDEGILRIFVLQGFIVGTVGTLCGVGLGFLVIRFRNDILHFASRISGMELFPKKYYFFSELPANIVPQDVTFIVLCSILLCTAGALIPAWRASRLAPAEALRYE